VAQYTLVLLLFAISLIILDLFLPSGGLLAGTGIALILERGLAYLGVATSVRWPLAAVGMLVTVGMAIRFGERLSERLFPARILTNVDRLVGSEARVHRVEGEFLLIRLEGDLWKARVALDSPPVEPGDHVRVVALRDQVPIIKKEI